MSRLAIIAVVVAIGVLVVTFRSDIMSDARPENVVVANSPDELSRVVQQAVRTGQNAIRIESRRDGGADSGSSSSTQSTTIQARQPSETERADILRRASAIGDSARKRLENLKNDGDEWKFNLAMIKASQDIEMTRAVHSLIDSAFISDRVQVLLEDTEETYYWSILLPFRDREGADVAYVPIALKDYPAIANGLRTEKDLKGFIEVEQAAAWQAKPHAVRRELCDRAKVARESLKRSSREFRELTSKRERIESEVRRLAELVQERAALEKDSAAVPNEVDLTTCEWRFRYRQR